MAASGKEAKAAAATIGNPAEGYHHPEADSVMRPNIGTPAQFCKKKEPQICRYGSSLTPAMLLFAVHVLLFGCQKPSAPKPVVNDPAFRTPTATEVFNLRSKCAELGKKTLEQNIIVPTLAQEQVSHYDPKTNRCYVELDVHMADLTKYEDSYARYLHDGQTGEILAWSRSNKGIKTGFVSGGPPETLAGETGFFAANGKIDALMADDRKQ